MNHLGLQVESEAELASVRGRFAAADARATVDEPGANCCYAKSDKHWVTDPQGIAWEAFHTLGTIPMFGGEADGAPSCCAAMTEEVVEPTARSTQAGAPTVCCMPSTRTGTAACCS